MTASLPARAGRCRVHGNAARAVLVAAVAFAVAGCMVSAPVAQSVPDDYRARHPIVVKEAARTVEILIGSARGGLTPAQRADVFTFARAWRREATGGIIIDVPSGTNNDRAAADALREVRSLLEHAGVPPQVIAVQRYRPSDPIVLGTIKLNYSKMTAQAGPCGLWPDDLGPTYDTLHNENRQYYNFGCASQRNLAAMVDNPADLVQPRGESPSYTARRSQVLDKYRQGQGPATVYPNPDKGTISDVGK